MGESYEVRSNEARHSSLGGLVADGFWAFLSLLRCQHVR